MTGREGYSLLETMVAFAITAMVLAVVLPAQGRLLARGDLDSQRLLANDYALSLLAEYSVMDNVMPGTEAFLYRDWSIEVAIVLAESNLEDIDVYEVSVEVSDRRARALATAQTFMLGEVANQ